MKIIIFFLLFLLCKINLINCQTPSPTDISIFDISDSISSNIYSKNPVYSSSKECIFQFRLLVTLNTVSATPLNDTLDFIDIGSPVSPPTYVSSIINQNLTASVFNIEINNVAYGDYSVNISSSINLNPSKFNTYTLNFKCEEIIFENLNYEIQGTIINSNIDIGSLSGVFKLLGLKYNYPLQFSSSNEVSIESLYDNYYTVTFNIQKYIGTTINDWSFSIDFPDNKKFQVSFPSIFKNDSLIPINYKSYPDFVNDAPYVLNCQENCGSLYTYEIDTSLSMYKYPRPLIYVHSPIDPKGLTPILISTLNGIYKYIGSYPNGNNIFPIYGLNYTEPMTLIPPQTKFSGSSFNSGNFFSLITVTSSLDNILTNLPMVYIKINDDNGIYLYNFIQYSYQQIYIESRFPFGFVGGNNNQFKMDVTFLKAIDSLFQQDKITIYSYGVNNQVSQTISNNNIIGETEKTIVKLFKVEIMENQNSLHITINYKDRFGLSKISIGANSIDPSNLIVSGDLKEGVLEILLDLQFIDFYSYYDQGYTFLSFLNNVGNQTEFQLNDIISMGEPTEIFSLPSISKPMEFDVLSISNVSFAYNYIDVTNTTIGNRITFNITGIDSVYRPIGFKINEPITRSILQFYEKQPVKWNEEIKLFQADFFIRSNTPVGNIPYIIQFGNTFIESNYLSSDSQLFVNRSYNADIAGPIFKEIIKLSSSSQIGWNFTIQDTINGFENGYIVIYGSVDNSIYNYSISPSSNYFRGGDIFTGDYQVVINTSSIYNSEYCVTQNYIISDVHLVDANGFATHYSVFKPRLVTSNMDFYAETFATPFINYLNNPNIYSINFTCNSASKTVTSETQLLYFKSSKSTMDLGLIDRNISFEFEVKNENYGLKEDQYPIVYLITKDSYGSILNCQSQIIQQNKTNAKYQCEMELPIAFGYLSGGFILSVYGFIDNSGNYTGFSTTVLKDYGFSYFVNTTVLSFNQPIITGSGDITTLGGTLWIYGRSLLNNQFSIQYLDGLNLNETNVTPFKSFNNAVYFKNIKPTSKPIIIKSTLSNQYIIIPTNYGFEIPLPTQSPSPSPTPTPTASIIPTNPPQKCLNNCGGEKQGYCTSEGCHCINNWIGNDCSSKIIIIPQPSINNTDPSVIIPNIPGGGSDGNSSNSNSEDETVFYKSLISLVSLRELDYNNKELKSYIFKQWIFTPINSSTSKYFTNITNGDTITNITTILQWYTESTNITFANSNLVMNPSTMKFTIEITNYNFSNQLNQLQLIMSTSFESNKNDKDTCSQTEIGDTSSGDNSNFIKLNIDNHSLYGRFIKRGIIDGFVKSINNLFYDSSFNEIDQSTLSTSASASSNIQSFIGITIPWYRQLILIDPDFSVLVSSDSNSVSSLCKSKSNGLSASKIAGIVIGGVAFLAVVTTITVYSIYKKKKDTKFINNMNQKMKNLN